LGTSEVKTAYALDNRAPSQVQNVNHSLDNNNNPILSWDAVAATDLDSYNIYVWDGSSYNESNPVVSTLSTSATLTAADAADKDYVIVARDRHNNYGEPSNSYVITSLENMQKPKSFALGKAFPNPFNPTAVVPFELPVASSVRIEVYNMLGNRISVLADRRYSAGSHTIRIDGSQLASGIYFIRANLGSQIFQQKVTLMK
jgi:hypothetical protein